MEIRRSSVLTLMLLVVLGSAGCAPRVSTTGKLSVVASFYPLYEFAQRVGGERIAVRNLIPAGVEPHDFEPTPQDVAGLTRTRVLIYNGAGFEPWLEKLFHEFPPDVVTVNATDGLPLVHGVQEDGQEGKSQSSASGNAAYDPHVWLDPVLAAQQADRIIAGLAKADPDGLAVYQANGVRLKDDLNALHRRYAQALASCRLRVFITSHAAFGYLARRYGLTQVSVSGLSPETEPSPARLKEIVQEARRTGTRVIYYETLVSPRVAQVIAQEVGARAAVLNPIEGLTVDEQRAGRSYFTVMDENLRNLTAGLDCR